MNAHDTLTQVNVDLNREQYIEDIGPDDWTPIVPGQGGDCDSYATAKMQRLFDKGWPIDQLRLATCWVEPSAGGGYHCVLLVDMDDKQTWVLDNRYPLPMEYQLLDYNWHKVQVPGTQRWQFAASYDPKRNPT